METRKREKILHTGEAIKIETKSSYTAEFIIKNSKFGKLNKYFSGHYFGREEGGKVIIMPRSEKVFGQMKSYIGRNHFKEYYAV